MIRGFTGSLGEALRTLSEGIAISQDASLSLEMLLEGFGITVYLADYERMRDLCGQAADFSPVTPEDGFIVAVLTGAAAELDGDYTRAHEQLACAIEIADRLDDVRCLIWVSAGVGRAGSWGDGLPYASRAVRLARERALSRPSPTRWRRRRPNSWDGADSTSHILGGGGPAPGAGPRAAMDRDLEHCGSRFGRRGPWR